jgi:hypothetical protein
MALSGLLCDSHRGDKIVLSHREHREHRDKKIKTNRPINKKVNVYYGL